LVLEKMLRAGVILSTEKQQHGRMFDFELP
jgi:hypothetical protein